MKKVEICGASDDLIEIDGDISEEFNPPYESDDGDMGLLAFSDGTVLNVVYGNEGIWRLSPVHHGTAVYEITQGTDAHDDYTDRVTLTGDIEWVVLGSQMAKAKSES